MENLSYVNPRGAIKVFQSQQINDFWSSWLNKYDKVAAVDGAVHKVNGQYVKAGIGGLSGHLMDQWIIRSQGRRER